MLLQPSCGDSTCQRASHVAVDVALHGGDAAPSPGMRRHRAGATGHGAEDPRTTVRTTAIHIHSTHLGRSGRSWRQAALPWPLPTQWGARCSRSRVGCFPNPLPPARPPPPSCVPTVQLSAPVEPVHSRGPGSCRHWNRRAPHMVELSGEEAAFPAANAGSLLCVALRFWAQRARLQSMSEGRQHCPGTEGSAYPAEPPWPSPQSGAAR